VSAGVLEIVVRVRVSVAVVVRVRMRMRVAVSVVNVRVVVRMRCGMTVCVRMFERLPFEDLAVHSARADDGDCDPREQGYPRVDRLGHEVAFEEVDRNAECEDADRMRDRERACENRRLLDGRTRADERDREERFAVPGLERVERTERDCDEEREDDEAPVARSARSHI
jgi:hypothetical protein